MYKQEGSLRFIQISKLLMQVLSSVDPLHYLRIRKMKRDETTRTR